MGVLLTTVRSTILTSVCKSTLFFRYLQIFVVYIKKNGHFADVNCKLPLRRNISEFAECISANPIN